MKLHTKVCQVQFLQTKRTLSRQRGRTWGRRLTGYLKKGHEEQPVDLLCFSSDVLTSEKMAKNLKQTAGTKLHLFENKEFYLHLLHKLHSRPFKRSDGSHPQGVATLDQSPDPPPP